MRLGTKVIIALFNKVRVFLHHADIVVCNVQCHARCCGYAPRISWPTQLKVRVAYYYRAILPSLQLFMSWTGKLSVDFLGRVFCFQPIGLFYFGDSLIF